MNTQRYFAVLAACTGLLVACNHQSSSSEVASRSVEQGVVQGCGVAPRWPCASAKCTVFDDGTHVWEPEPYPAGRARRYPDRPCHQGESPPADGARRRRTGGGRWQFEGTLA